MHAVMSLVAASAVSISAGWTKLPTGGYEYIIQIEPEAIATLAAGEDFTSEVPPEARDVRSYRVHVGREQLPRESGPPPAETTLPLGAPPADATLDLGPPPDTTPTPPAAAAAPEGGPRHVGIHADPAKEASVPPSIPGYEADKVGPPHEGTTGPSATLTGQKSGEGDGAKEPAKALWAPLFGALLALFASVGGNVFLGWTAVNMRGRYKALLAHQQMA